MTFAKGRTTNPAGRPPGIRPIRRTDIAAAFNRAVEPHVEELFQRSVSAALAGDSAALSGLLALLGHTLPTAETKLPGSR